MITTKKHIKIFIVAGEVSGDVLGAKIMRQMPNVDFVGIGGQNMISVGLKSLFPMSDLSVMGITEVLRHARTLSKRINQTISAIIHEQPDVVLTIDSPGFAKSVIKKVRKKNVLKNTRFYHVVAPQVWAWGANRASKYAKIFDKLYAFFDFEKPYFEKYGLNTMAIGHPIAEGLDKYKNNSDDKKIITFIPGSRMSEVKKLLPIFHNTIELLGDKYDYIIPTVETTDGYIQEHIAAWKIKPKLVSADNRYDVYANTYIAVAASGTVSVELAIMHVPTIVVYKMNMLTSLIAKALVRVRWASLVNILMNTTIFPELLGKNANTQQILAEIQNMNNPSTRNKIISQLKKADNLWLQHGHNPSQLIADDILNQYK